MLRSCKGSSGYLMYWLIFKIGFLIVVCFTVFLIVNSTLSSIDYGSRSFDGKIVARSLYYSDLFMEYDEKLDHVNTGYIDLEKWNVLTETGIDAYLNSSDVDYVVMKLTLKDLNYESIYYKKDLYNEWNLFFEGFKKADRNLYAKSIQNFPVIVNNKNVVLVIEVIVPNE